MKLTYYNVLVFLVLSVFTGCANQTTDPRQGGLFSYNPQAYDKRLQDRKENLSETDRSNLAAQKEATRLKAEQSSRSEKIAVLKKKLNDLSASTVSLEKKVLASKAKTADQKTEQKRILAEINTIQSSLMVTDDMEDPEEKRLELERLKKKRNQLETEAANLMLL